MDLLPVYIILGSLFLVGILAITGILIVYYGKHYFKPESNGVVQFQSESSPQRLGNNLPKPSGNYAVLEDHLDLIDSPILSVGGTAHQISAAAYIRKHAPAPMGVTLEFHPDDNTILQVEGTHNTITKITRIRITIEERQRKLKYFSIHKGQMDNAPISIYVFPLTDNCFEMVKKDIMAKDQEIDQLTSHPRYVRYLGTCFNAVKKEAYVITDFVAGATIQEIWKSPDIRQAMELSEEEKIQASMDLADAVYFLHGHSTPVVHGLISLASVVIDGETHRAKLMASASLRRIHEILEKIHPEDDFTDLALNSNFNLQERAPETVKSTKEADMKTDIWALGCTIMEFIFDQYTWDFHNLNKQFNVKDSGMALDQAVALKLEPSIVMTVRSANPKLQFLTQCLQYNSVERPSATFITTGLQQCILEIQRDNRVSIAQASSFVFPGRRIINSARTRKFDPLIRQQIEWNVKQDAGRKKRAILFGNRNYLGRDFKSLSVTPLNDIKDMTTMLSVGGFGLSNIYENIPSRQHLEDILKAFVEAINKEPEEIELLVLYFSGLGVQGLPKKLAQKRRLGVFLDRVGISHDLALATGNETLFPVAKLQTILCTLNAKVKRKLVILDIRIADNSKGRSMRRQMSLDPFATQNHFDGGTFGMEDQVITESDFDWDVPIIGEESIDKLPTMFTIYPSIDEYGSVAVADSHPRRTNGFLTGCLINVLKDYARLSIEDLPRILNDEMADEGDKSKIFRGIQCQADFIPVSGDIWSLPFITKH
ncbi:uncharacterized protein LOC131884201 isoform X2 [Tigriopus californicus]|uniref:uncharacterized protein LOC131884201 isoform X2 n=1 Tax=Tigriopus californicus TaxID=6832 RepID=UPI0027DA53D5|nr:uncharacterized protein LOC131884201 isoform X2 [Tigriopus californicus]